MAASFKHLVVALAVISCGLFLVPTETIAASPASLAIATSSAQRTKEVALTFDDGPYGTSTQQILDILTREHVPATFFLIGKNVEKYPYLAKEIVQDGEEVGNHTLTHPHLPSDAETSALTEVSTTESIIASTTGVRTSLFRPPYGQITPLLKKDLTAEGYQIAMWNVDPMDWNDTLSPSTKIVSRILSHERQHMIIIMHDGRDTHVNYSRANTIAALPTIIDDLKKQGYTFVKVDALLATSTSSKS